LAAWRCADASVSRVHPRALRLASSVHYVRLYRSAVGSHVVLVLPRWPRRTPFRQWRGARPDRQLAGSDAPDRRSRYPMEDDSFLAANVADLRHVFLLRLQHRLLSDMVPEIFERRAWTQSGGDGNLRQRASDRRYSRRFVRRLDFGRVRQAVRKP